jgi:peptide/nickel transport system ATP-binding protein
MTPLIALEQVSFRYGDRTVLRDLTLSVTPGERLGIAGPSASGKSTLARLLTRHLEPTSGVVHTPAGLSVASLQLVFQDPGLTFAPQWQVWQIAAEAAAIAGRSVREQEELATALLERVCLPARVATCYPLELSGGERRRLAIARALGASPAMLVLDESLSGLDPLVQRDLLNLLAAIQRDMPLALVIVSHDLRLLRRAVTRIALLDAGHLVEDQPAAELFAQPMSAVGRRLLAACYAEGSLS